MQETKKMQNARLHRIHFKHFFIKSTEREKIEFFLKVGKKDSCKFKFDWILKFLLKKLENSSNN